MRILVTGSRDWTNKMIIFGALAHEWVSQGSVTPRPVLVSGACPTGADHFAEEFAAVYDWPVELHPANWTRHGKRAGFVRNAEMAEAGADICLAFIKNGSRGATMMADLAEKAGIKTVRFVE